MNSSMTEFRWFSEIFFVLVLWTKVSALEGIIDLSINKLSSETMIWSSGRKITYLTLMRLVANWANTK